MREILHGGARHRERAAALGRPQLVGVHEAGDVLELRVELRGGSRGLVLLCCEGERGGACERAWLPRGSRRACGGRARSTARASSRTKEPSHGSTRWERCAQQPTTHSILSAGAEYCGMRSSASSAASQYGPAHAAGSTPTCVGPTKERVPICA